MNSYSLYIMRISGDSNFRGVRKVGIAKNSEHRRQSIETSLRKEFGQQIRVFIEHIYEIPAKNKGGFLAYNIEHQLQTYIKKYNYRFIKMPKSQAGRSEWFKGISTPKIKKYLACSCRYARTNFVGMPKEWERKTNGQMFKKGVYNTANLKKSFKVGA